MKFPAALWLRLERGDFGNGGVGIIAAIAATSVLLRFLKKQWSVGTRDQRTSRSRIRCSPEKIRRVVEQTVPSTKVLRRQLQLERRRREVEREHVEPRRQQVERG